ncbi:MAG: DUF3105 domain-containing protein [Actinomycetes bacterium]
MTFRAAGIVLGVIVSTVLVVACSPSPTPEPSSEGIDGVQTYGDLTREHTGDAVDYPQSPPVGGDHDKEWVDCTGTVYDEVLPNGKAVHALEHGAVWVTYTDDADSGDVDVLAAKVEGQPYSFMSPYAEQEAPIVLTAWGVQLEVDDASDDRIDEFLTTYRSGAQTPEPGATCEAGDMA